MKVWLIYDDNGCYEGPWLRAVCTTWESALKAKELCDEFKNETHQIVEVETDQFWKDEKYGWIEDLFNAPFVSDETCVDTA